MIFKEGRSNLSCTIFVPWDCHNNCKFCNSKSEYQKWNKDLNKVLEDIEMLNYSKFFKTYVITGGEPFNDLDKLKQIVDKMEKPIFINTILPSNTAKEAVEYINSEEKIIGINISRHIGQNLTGASSLEDINKIEKPIRINTVMTDKFDWDAFWLFCKYFGGEKRLINLRADYRKIDNLTLKNRDEVCDKLLEKAENIGNGGCMVCHENSFLLDDIQISYHRGLQFSSFTIGDKCFINDIIVLPDGTICQDWDFKENEKFIKFILGGENGL